MEVVDMAALLLQNSHRWHHLNWKGSVGCKDMCNVGRAEESLMPFWKLVKLPFMNQLALCAPWYHSVCAGWLITVLYEAYDHGVIWLHSGGVARGAVVVVWRALVCREYAAMVWFSASLHKIILEPTRSVTGMLLGSGITSPKITKVSKRARILQRKINCRRNVECPRGHDCRWSCDMMMWYLPTSHWI